jgi:hypothetical protein
MKNYLILLVLLLTAACGGAVQTSTTVAAVGPSQTYSPVEIYDDLVLTDRPVFFLASTGEDLAGNMGYVDTGHLHRQALPNNDSALYFNGQSDSLCFADNDLFSVTTTGALTLEAWVNPAVLEFPKDESGGYVHWLGKGTSGQHEYVLRMYSFTNTENRPNRMSGYAFNLAGGLGIGSYVQEPVRVGEWVHLTVVININPTQEFPKGYTILYKNGVQRDKDSLAPSESVPMGITAQNGTAPFCIATRNGVSFWRGAIGKVAVYNYELTPAQIQAHTARMWQ